MSLRLQSKTLPPIREAIAERFLLPVDLLTRSYETFTTYRPNPNSTLSRMLEDSEVPYDRRAALALLETKRAVGIRDPSRQAAGAGAGLVIL